MEVSGEGDWAFTQASVARRSHLCNVRITDFGVVAVEDLHKSGLKSRGGGGVGKG
jgi:hypothetical protein